MNDHINRRKHGRYRSTRLKRIIYPKVHADLTLFWYQKAIVLRDPAVLNIVAILIFMWNIQTNDMWKNSVKFSDGYMGILKKYAGGVFDKHRLSTAHNLLRMSAFKKIWKFFSFPVSLETAFVTEPVQVTTDVVDKS